VSAERDLTGVFVAGRPVRDLSITCSTACPRPCPSGAKAGDEGTAVSSRVSDDGSVGGRASASGTPREAGLALVLFSLVAGEAEKESGTFSESGAAEAQTAPVTDSSTHGASDWVSKTRGSSGEEKVSRWAIGSVSRRDWASGSRAR
jgi:hypothetical protein